MHRLVIACALTLMAVSAEADAAPIIVLDPGHGGTNTGAHGPEIKRYEKRLTLTIARATARYLRHWAPGLIVRLTRNRDEYLTLGERVRRANGIGADLFVSIHLNASESRTQHGYETFILTRQESQQEASRLAMQTSDKPAVLGRILSDLRQTAAHGESARLAKLVQQRMALARPHALNRGVRQAPFDVLMGLRMPGILAEVGFIDHPEESRQMARAATHEAIAAALAGAIVQHLSGRPPGSR